MLEQIKDFVKCGVLSPRKAISIVSNLVDMQKEEPTTELEGIVFDFFIQLEDTENRTRRKKHVLKSIRNSTDKGLENPKGKRIS